MKRHLAETSKGPVVIRSLEGGVGMQAHLAGMGIVTGMKINVMRNDGNGPVVVRVHNARIAIGRFMAAKILVESDLKV